MKSYYVYIHRKATSDGVEYESVVDAVNALEKQLCKRVLYSNIMSVLRGKSKTAYGYKWKYLEKETQ
jgi:hypothetical protein